MRADLALMQVLIKAEHWSLVSVGAAFLQHVILQTYGSHSRVYRRIGRLAVGACEPSQIASLLTQSPGNILSISLAYLVGDVPAHQKVFRP